MGSFWTTAELRAHGKTPREIRRAVRAGLLREVRRGWHAHPAADLDLVRAVRIGGLATAHTAARARGLWAPPDRAGALAVLHVAVPPSASASRLHDPDDASLPFAPRDDVRIHRTDGLRLGPDGTTGMVDLVTMLEQLFRCETPERALAVVDSTLQLRHLRPSDLPALASRVPTHLRPVVMSADGRAESGIETTVRFLLRLRGLHVEVQVPIDGVGTVDLLVDGRVIIECDGREWHDDAAAFGHDRTRDLGATAGRYRTIRLTWHHVLFCWDECEAAILAALHA